MHKLLGNDLLAQRLERRKDQDLMRHLVVKEGLVDLTSNDYFGFASSKDLPNAPLKSGSTGSRLLTGNSAYYEALEKKIADYHSAESCLIFNTGYMANLGLISALGSKEVTFLYDIDIHASMIDGMSLTKARLRPFRHNDISSLKARLKEADLPVYILIESVYSLKGDLAPLTEMVLLAEEYGASLIVDEAHATGLYGERGEGRVQELGLESRVFARVHTFGKALGAHGACVLGSTVLKEYLVNFSRPFIYTTALPLSTLLLIEASYEKMQKEAKKHQTRLRELIGYFQKNSNVKSFSPSPIQPIFVPGTKNVRELSKICTEHGLDIRPIVAPSAKNGKEFLRLVLHSFNSEEELDQLFGILREHPWIASQS